MVIKKANIVGGKCDVCGKHCHDVYVLTVQNFILFGHLLCLSRWGKHQ